jgi:hypothetical protein
VLFSHAEENAMRKTWLLFPAWASVGFLVYACDDEATGPAKDGGADAPTATQTTPMPDAGEMMDQFTPPQDAGVDAFDAGPQPGPVDVQVVDGTGAPVSGQDVYFTESTGTIVKVTTDATGHAVHLMLAGGSVSVLRIDGTIYDVTTVMSVAQNDHILITPPPSDPFNVVGTVSGNFTSAPLLDAGAGPLTYSLDFGGCNASTTAINTTSFSANLTPDCLVPGKGLSFVVLARDASGTLVGQAPKTVTTIPDGGTITADVAAADWGPAVGKQASYTGALVSPFNQFQTQVGSPRNGLEFGIATATGTVQPSLTYYPIPGATFAPNIQALSQESGYYMGTDYVVLAHGVRGPAATTVIAEDLAKNLPRLSGMTVGGTTAAPSVSWASAIGVDSVGSSTLFGFHTPDGGVGYQVRWQVVFPAASTTTSVQFPSLPAAILSQVTPDNPWGVDNQLMLVSPQLPYSLGHLLPTPLGYGVGSVTTVANAIPGLTTFDARMTYIMPNSG